MMNKIIFASVWCSISLQFLGSDVLNPLRADTLPCGGSDRIERLKEDVDCQTLNYTIVAPCDLANETLKLKCNLGAPTDFDSKIQKLENLCQDACADYGSQSVSEGLKFDCIKGPNDVCSTPCRPGSQAQSQTCNVKIKREVSEGSPTLGGMCSFVCSLRFRWDFSAVIDRNCSVCVPF